MKRLVMFLLITALTPVMVRSEFFIDAFGGKTYVQSGSFSATENREIELPGGELTSQGDLSGAESSGFGLRGGYWIGAKKLQWLGVAGDLNYFQADAQDFDAEASFVSLSLMLMFRYPLMMSEKYPHGRFYPYAGIGGTRAVVDISSPTNSSAQGTVNSDIAGVLCTGIKWMVTPKLGLFAEYRFVSISFDDSDVDVNSDLFGWTHTRVFEAEGDAQAHQLLGGIAYHF